MLLFLPKKLENGSLIKSKRFLSGIFLAELYLPGFYGKRKLLWNQLLLKACLLFEFSSVVICVIELIEI